MTYKALLTTCLVVFGFLGDGVNAHGWVKSPPSRQQSCYSGAVSKNYCGGAEYEPQGVEGLKGAPFDREVGRSICNGGSGRFNELNIPGNNTWPRQLTSPNKDLELTWRFANSPDAQDYHYYITKANFDESYERELTKDDFERSPIASFPGGPTGYEDVIHTIPAASLRERQGYSIMLAVQNVDDNPDAFYNCIDIEFIEQQLRSFPTLPPTKPDLR
jgi:predicted carbohydrate-binding protein with CBM5 and CBM33 domain